jgi:hypothetical protein
MEHAKGGGKKGIVRNLPFDKLNGYDNLTLMEIVGLSKQWHRLINRSPLQF